MARRRTGSAQLPRREKGGEKKRSRARSLMCWEFPDRHKRWASVVGKTGVLCGDVAANACVGGEILRSLGCQSCHSQVSRCRCSSPFLLFGALVSLLASLPFRVLHPASSQSSRAKYTTSSPRTPSCTLLRLFPMIRHQCFDSGHTEHFEGCFAFPIR